MVSIWLLIFFVFGAIVGSFLNVLVLRYGARSLLGTRSACGSCGKVLAWFELVPIASFFIQRRRCLGCKSKISWQYPLVELITGLVFAAVFWKHFSFLSLFSYSVIQLSVMPAVIQLLVITGELLVWSLLIALSVYDLRHKIIPDALVYAAVLASFLLMLVRTDSAAIDAWGSVFLAAPFAAIWFFSRGRLMGLGDAKLLLLFSPFLGFAKGLSALLVGFWIGAIVSIAALLCKGLLSSMPEPFCPSLKSRLKNLTMKTELPLAPFLVFGLFLVYLTGIDVTGLDTLLQ